jgi:hypothetical protein
MGRVAAVPIDEARSEIKGCPRQPYEMVEVFFS